MAGKKLYLIPFQDKYLIYRPLRGLLFLGNRAMADLAQRYCDTGDRMSLADEPEVLDFFAKKRAGVKVTIFTSEHYDKNHVPRHKISDADIKTFNAQYPKLVVRYNESFHDRFLIVDDKELYLIGASLKDLGRKCFGFTKMDKGEIRRIKKEAFGVGRR